MSNSKRFDLCVSRKDDSGKSYYTKVGAAFYSPDKDVISIKIDENIAISREAVCFPGRRWFLARGGTHDHPQLPRPKRDPDDDVGF